MRKGSLAFLLLAAALLGLNCPAQSSPDIIVTVDTPPASAPDVSSLLWGHNIRFLNNGEFLWYTADTVRGIGQIKTEVLDELQAAASSQASVLRYPGGAHGDTNRWRTGVGNFKHIDPYVDERREYSATWKQIPKFGTDEVVAFARGVSANMKPLMQVNWWHFNSPGGSEPAAETGLLSPSRSARRSEQTCHFGMILAGKRIWRDCRWEANPLAGVSRLIY